MSSQIRPHVFARLVVEPPPSAAVEQGPVAVKEVAPPDYEALAATARASGYQHGYEEGLRQATEEQQKSVARLARVVRAASQQNEQFLQTVEQQVIRLSLAIAAKVVEREIQSDQSVVLGVVRSAMQEITDATRLFLRVNPEDYELIAQHWESIKKPAASRSELVADGRVEAGGCVIETQVSEVDAQPSTRLAQIATTFAALLEGEPL